MSYTPATAGGDLSGTYPNPQIAAGAIVDADINASAAIPLSKVKLWGLTCYTYLGSDNSVTTGTSLKNLGNLGPNATYPFYSVVTDGIIVPWAGWYAASALVFWSANATGTRTQVITTASSFTAIQTSVRPVSTASIPTQLNTSGIVYCTAGDKILLKVAQTSGATLSLASGPGGTELTVAYLGV